MKLRIDGNTVFIDDLSGAESDAINAAIAANPTGDHFEVAITTQMPIGDPPPGPSPVTVLALQWTDPVGATDTPPGPSPPIRA